MDGPEPSPLHKRSQSLPNISVAIGFAFSYPPGPGAPEVQFSAQISNPWIREAPEQSSTSAFKLTDPVDVVPVRMDPATQLRRFQVHSQKNKKAFANNSVQTTKYTAWNFLFRNLYAQFRVLANIYFLFISILQFLPVSSVSPTTWFPLTVVLLTNMVKEACEDMNRAKLDHEVNGRTVQALNPMVAQGGERLVSEFWKNVYVGHVLFVKEDEALPADVIVLATSDEKSGLAYIETSQLDGETNLKHRESVQQVHQELQRLGLSEGQHNLSIEGIRLLSQVVVECEPPNDKLATFNGVLNIGDTKVPVNNKQVLYRGCYLRNTQWIYGLVVYTGMDTKLMQSANETRIKSTSLDKLSNKYVIGIFWFLAIMCVLGGGLSALFIILNPRSPWYLMSPDPWQLELCLNTLTFLILLSYMIPISLTVSAEIVKIGHAYFIDHDLAMCYTVPESGDIVPAQARTSNLGEDLGRVRYVFTDKTGTLTRNVMEFMKCSIGGCKYGSGMTEIGRAAVANGQGHLFASRPGSPLAGADFTFDERPPDAVLEPNTNFWDPQISGGAWRDLPEPQRSRVRDFHVHLAVCHTLLAKLVEPTAGWVQNNVQYQASSPDELALVYGARGNGFWFMRRTGPQLEVMVEGEVLTYQVLNVCEFNSTRKRSSCVVRFPDGRLMALVKGADNVMYPQFTNDNDEEILDKTRLHLQGYANEGLRTLVLAQKELDAEWYRQWNATYVEALTSMSNREQQLDKCAVELERDLQLVGVTAIEDKLQEGVPDALSALLRAGIKVWMLTGDMVETAVNIATACNLIQPGMRVQRIVVDEEFRGHCTDNLMEQLQEAKRAMDAGHDVAIVINGVALEGALNDEEEKGMHERGLFLQVATRCRTVVCCRLFPADKSQVVHLVRKKEKVITVGIGDGANDVPMIRDANIGVGISGQEGMQAVMSSDYAIAQFRFLTRLLLVHGRWNMQRLSILILYFFYKNCNIALVSFWYGIYTEFSGVRYWNDFYGTMWNCLFTAFPVFTLGLFNKDFQYATTPMHHNHLYKEVQSGQDFSATRFWSWMLSAVYDSLVVFFVPVFVMEGKPVFEDGQMHGKWVLSLTSFWCLALVTNLRLGLVTRTWTRWSVVVIVLSTFSFFPFSWAFLYLPEWISGTMHGSIERCMVSILFWLCSVLCAVLCLLPPFALQVFHKAFHPSETQQRAQEEAAIIQTLKNQNMVVTDLAVKANYEAEGVEPIVVSHDMQ